VTLVARPKSDGLRVTKVGLWYVFFLVVVAASAANTGNNGLYLTLAAMTGLLAVANVLGARNVRGLDVDLDAHGELFAHRMSRFDVTLANRSRWWPGWLLVLAVEPAELEPRELEPGAESPRRSAPFLVRFLAPRETVAGRPEVMLRRRGRHAVRAVHVSSLFPLGLFHKGRRYPADLEVLVYPEVYHAPASYPEQGGKSGDRPTRRAGWGHDLFGLRAFRHGDDPRGIHWKQTARTGTLIFKERETEDSRRLLIVFENGVGELTGRGRVRFERLVSEAATAALDYLQRGFEVSLLTRDGAIPFAAGLRQRRTLLEALALIEPRERQRAPLEVPDSRATHLRLAMEPEERAA